MKKILLLLACLFAVSCVTTPCKECPSKAVYFLVEPGILVSVPKGFFDDSDNYWTEEEIKELSEQREVFNLN